MLHTQEALDGVMNRLGALADRERHESYNRTRIVLEEVTRTVGTYQGKRVLDVGCSIGIHALAAKELGADVYGVDKFTLSENTETNPFYLQREAFEAVQEIWKEKGIQVKMHDVEDPLPFPDNTFDIIVSNAVIEHLHGTHRNAIQECARVLKPGGILLISTPNLAYILKRIRFLLGRSPNWDLKDFFFSGKQFTGHTREFTVQEVKRMMSWVGLEVIHARARSTYFRWKWVMQPKKWASIASFFMGFLSGSFGDNVYVIAKKKSI